MKNYPHRSKWKQASIIAFSAWLYIYITSLDCLAQQVQDDTSSAPSLSPAINSATDDLAPEEADDIRDIRNPVKIPYPWLPYVIILGIVVAFHAILFLLFRWLKRRGKKKEEAFKLTPYDQALKDLENTRPLMEAGQDKAFSIAVSDVLRHYIEGQFAMPAPERTTEEFLVEISEHDLIKESLEELLRGFLQLCDLVKFAGQPLGRRQMKELYSKAKDFIEESYVKSHMQAAMLGQDTTTLNINAS